MFCECTLPSAPVAVIFSVYVPRKVRELARSVFDPFDAVIEFLKLLALLFVFCA